MRENNKIEKGIKLACHNSPRKNNNLIWLYFMPYIHNFGFLHLLSNIIAS